MVLSRVALLVAFASLPLTSSKLDDESASDLALLQGTWRVVSWEKDGVVRRAEDMPGLRPVTFTNETFLWEGDPHPGTLRLDATSRPRRVDYTNALPDGSQSASYAG